MNKRLPLFIVVTLIFFLGSSTPVHATIFDDIITGAKQFIPGEKNKDKKEFKIVSDITLASGGDVDVDKEIDAGDTVRFTYTITNTTDKEYSFATLKTNINRKQINFIHNVSGTANLDDDRKTIIIPNFRIAPNQISTVSFDARINYDTKEDSTISSEAEFLSNDKKIVAKSLKKEIRVKRGNQNKNPGIIHQGIG